MIALRNRRGVIAIFTVVVFLAMLAISAVVVDLSRMQVMRSQLQTAADAAALAGALQLLHTPKSDYLAQAQQYGGANSVLNSPVVVGATDVVYGNWNAKTRTFTRSSSVTTADAIQVTLQRQPASYASLIAKAIGWRTKPIAVRSVAWAGAATSQTKCMKPWALWYGLLMQRVNAYRQMTGDTRPMTPEDLQALREMSEDQRTFNVFLGSLNDKSQVLNSGNFYAVDLPPVQYADGTPGTPLTGGSAYANTLAGVDKNGNPVCYSVGVGDVLQTEPGEMIGPTKQGVDPYICAKVVGNDCYGADGNHPMIKSAFWTQATNKGSGKFTVSVTIIGSFVLKQYYQKSNELHIVGTFEPTLEQGPVSEATTTLVTLKLVK